MSASMSAAPATKDELRRRLREARRALDAGTRRHAAQQLALQLLSTRAFRASRHIACYLPIDGEIDTSDVIDHLRRLRKHCYLPVVSRLTHDRLWFAHAPQGVELRARHYGILEPQVATRELVRAQALDLILLPLVGFDASGNRLGMGGGYYDRSLEFLRHRRHWRKPYVIGLAYDLQKIPALPRDAWDVPLNAIVTDRAIYSTPDV